MEEEVTLDPRHVARAIALQQLFNHLFPDTNAFEDNDLLEVLEVEDYDRDLCAQIVEGVQTSQEEIDPYITQFAPSWPIDQIAPIDLLILRMGIWEGFISKITPAKVVINECIELAKEFGGENSSSFINGVLGNLFVAKDNSRQAA